MKQVRIAFVPVIIFSSCLLFSMQKNDLQTNILNLVDHLHIIENNISKNLDTLLKTIEDKKDDLYTFIHFFNGIPDLLVAEPKTAAAIPQAFNSFVESAQALGNAYKDLSFTLGIDYIDPAQNTLPKQIEPIIKKYKKEEIVKALNKFKQNLEELGKELDLLEDTLNKSAAAKKIQFSYDSGSTQSLVDNIKSYIRPLPKLNL